MEYVYKIHIIKTKPSALVSRAQLNSTNTYKQEILLLKLLLCILCS